MIVLMKEDELYHHGRLGQKWGQHIFSSLKEYAYHKQKNAEANRKTKARVKKIARDEKNKEKVLLAKKKADDKMAKFKEKNGIDDGKSKGNNNLTNAELKSKIERLRLEKDLLVAQKDLKKELPATKKQKVTDFIGEKVFKETVVPAAQKAGKNYIQAKLEDMLGVKFDKNGNVMLKDLAKAVDVAKNDTKEDSKKPSGLKNKVSDLNQRANDIGDSSLLLPPPKKEKK